MESKSHVVTLLTDVGLKDHFIAAMKGVMLEVNPGLAFVDITHLVPAQDIHSGAFTLAQASACFPAGTVHLAVVDPGVGTARKALAVSAGGQFFVAPDNGLLSYIYEREVDFSAYEITADHYFRKPISSTFHGRDIFAPVAAWITRDIPLNKFGPRLQEPVRLKVPTVNIVQDALVQGAVLAVDHFGNLITNLRPELAPVYSQAATRTCKLVAGHRDITTFKRTFGEGSPGELFVIPGSCGYLEIVMRDKSAAEELCIGPGAPVGIVIG